MFAVTGCEFLDQAIHALNRALDHGELDATLLIGELDIGIVEQRRAHHHGVHGIAQVVSNDRQRITVNATRRIRWGALGVGEYAFDRVLIETVVGRARIRHRHLKSQRLRALEKSK